MAGVETKLSFSVDLKGAQSAQKMLDDLNKKALDAAKAQRDQATAVADAQARVVEEAKKAVEAINSSGKREDAEHKKKLRRVKDIAKQEEKASNDAGRVQEKAVEKVRRLEEKEHREKLKRAVAIEKQEARQGERRAYQEKRAQERQAVREQRSAAAQPVPVTAHTNGAFTQGLLQGAMPGDISRIIDRGPGGLRQAAGIMAGSVGASLASIPFTGLGGIMSAAGSIGSAVSDPLSRIFGNTGSALGRQRSQLGMLPFLGGYGVQAMTGTGGLSQMSDAALHARAMQEASSGDISGLPVRQQTALLNRMKRLSDAQTNDISDPTARAAYLRASGADASGILPNIRADETRRLLAGPAEARLRAQRERDRNGDVGINPLRKLGEMYGGRDIGETQSFVAQMAMRAGGQADDLAQQGLIRSGLAANTKYGIGADVAGAYGRAGRIGGISGASGDDMGFAKMIGNAVALGLTGSDLTKYMEQTAQVLNNFEQTGMPLATASISAAAAGFKNMGLSAPMAASAGFGITQSLQQIGQNGPQDAFGVAVMQALGGSESYEGQVGAMEKLRDPTASTVNKVYRSVASLVPNRGRGRIGREGARQLAIRLGLPQDAKSVASLADAISSGKASLPTSLTDGLSADNLNASAAGLTPSVLSKEAAGSNTRASLGEKGAGVAQDAEALANTVASGVGSALGGPLRGISSALTMLTRFLEGHMNSGPVAKAVEATPDTAGVH